MATSVLRGLRHFSRNPAFMGITVFNTQCSRLSTNISDVVLTDSCIAQLKKVMEPGEHLRVIVEGGGCSGFQYKFEVDTKTNEDDGIIKKDGATVVIDGDSLEFVKGSKIDYQTELIKSAFVVIDNPQAEEGCSCGVSFNVKL